MTVAQPKLYWAAAESPANPSKDFGVYCVLMEWLGDDLKKAESSEGVTEEECAQARDPFLLFFAALTVQEIFLLLRLCGISTALSRHFFSGFSYCRQSVCFTQ